MSFDDDNRDDPIVFTREATALVITKFDGTPVDTIDIPELKLCRSEVSPEWLALEAEQGGGPDGA